MKVLRAYLCIVLGVSPSVLLAQTDVCLAMVTDAAHNISLTTSSSQFLYTLFDNYCKSDGSTKTSSWNAGVSGVVQEIPVGLTGGASDAGTAFTNFCRNYASTAAGSSTYYSMQSNVVQKALQSANQCMTIASRGSYVTYRIMTPKTLAINFNIGSGNPLKLRGVAHDASVSCEGSRANGAGVVMYSAGVGQSLSSDLGSYSITCTRTPTATASGQNKYPETSIVLDTNAGGFDIYWPQDTVFPLSDADQINGALTALNDQLTKTTVIANAAGGKIQTVIDNYGNSQSGAPGSNPVGSGPPSSTVSATCPAGQYVAGLSLGFSGTCHFQCNADGAILRIVTPICRALF